MTRPLCEDGSFPLTDDDHAIWRDVIGPQQTLLDASGHPAIARGFRSMGLATDAFPDLDVFRAFYRSIGWDFCVDDGRGEVNPGRFRELLATRTITTAAFVRSPDWVYDAPCPDLIHGLVSYGAQLADPIFCEALAAYGRRLSRSNASDPAIDRHFRFTVELALVRDRERLTVFGASLLDNHAWARDALDAPFIERVPYDMRTAIATPVERGKLPRRLFVFDDLLHLVEALLTVPPATRERALG